MHRAAALGLFLLASTVTAADREPVAFRADARVEVDANGKPTRIEASQDLPQAIRAYIEQRVATWTFSPPARDGVTGTGVTYLSLGACAIPEGNNYRLGLDFKHNGPRIATANGRVPLLAYPMSARRAGKDTVQMDVHFFIETDGRATLDKVVYADNESHRRDGFDALVKGWVRMLRFDPEQLAGQPVRSKASVQFIYKLGDGTTRSHAKQDALARAAISTECRMAAGEPTGLQPVVLDSPIKVLKAI